MDKEDKQKEVQASHKHVVLQDFELTRQHVWSQAWAYTANANDCKSTAVATRYADTCLAEFDKRFKHE